jgi:hypothetical protein
MILASHRLTIRGILDLLIFYVAILTILAVFARLCLILVVANLLVPWEAVSVFIAELPLGIGLWWFLGERRRTQWSEWLDSIQLGEKYTHLIVHYWVVGIPLLRKTFSVVENTKTRKAYDCPPFIEELSMKGVVDRHPHKNEPEMRAYLLAHAISLFDKKEATLIDLKP